MTRRRFDRLFPDGLSDESASALSEFVHQLAATRSSVTQRNYIVPRYPTFMFTLRPRGTSSLFQPRMAWVGWSKSVRDVTPAR